MLQVSKLEEEHFFVNNNVRACVRACARVFVRACVRVRVRARVFIHAMPPEVLAECSRDRECSS